MAEDSGTGIRRRTLMRTSAWAVPVIAAAASAPLAAASQTGPTALLQLRAGCVAFDDTTYYGAGFQLQNIGSVPFSGHINLQEFLDIDTSLLVGNIPYAFTLSRHRFTLGTLVPLTWNFPGNRYRGNRFSNFRGTLEPGQRIGTGSRFAWTEEAEVSDQPAGWLDLLTHQVMVRSITPDSGEVSGVVVDAPETFTWGAAATTCG
ncbi:hypothetical protein QF046_001387 [Microbacterium sp. W4I4]|uniref:hypothetical protein n=1 Tax=Microbacterium sp. W4I4 TaxID=3042295 RepID=UPI0027869E67|nr:hypothetical protein [Microbacterium sp. W4I4]MDQ0613746.1 hypothetical protein [Microbacterium sp. W4I4]